MNYADKGFTEEKVDNILLYARLILLITQSFLPTFVERKRLRDAGRDHLRIVWARSSKPGMRHV